MSGGGAGGTARGGWGEAGRYKQGARWIGESGREWVTGRVGPKEKEDGRRGDCCEGGCLRGQRFSWDGLERAGKGG